MKADIHPKFQTITFKCACGASYVAGSTMTEDFSTEICSACHPFYTGKQKLVDTGGRVERFAERTAKKAVSPAKSKRVKLKAKESKRTAKIEREEK